MTKKFGFFNSKNKDRVYSANDMNYQLKKIISNGVFANPSTNLQVKAGTGMNVLIQPGDARLDWKYFSSDAVETLTIEPADTTLDRIDRIVLRADMTNRTIDFYVKKGTNASYPSAPAITRNQNIYELCLANIYITKRITAITQVMITDTRLDTSICGVVTGLIDQVDTQVLFDQYDEAFKEDRENNQNKFDAWFNDVKDNLSDIVMWRELKRTVTTSTNNTTEIEIGINEYNSTIDILAVYVNGMRLNNDEYLNDDTNIVFTSPLDVTGTKIEIVVYKAVSSEGVETIVNQVTQLERRVSELETKIKNQV